MPNPENITPIKDTQRAKELGRLGGLKKGENYKIRKSLMSLYGRFLEKKFCVTVETGKGKRGKKKIAMTGEELVVKALEKALMNGNMLAVKELRESLDGKARPALDINKLLK